MVEKMTDILALVAPITTNILATGTSVMTFITAQPLILIPIVASFVFMGFKVVRSFAHV